MREPLYVAGSPVHVPVDGRAQAALTKYLATHVADLDAVLEPFGLCAADVAVPVFERYLFADEVRPR